MALPTAGMCELVMPPMILAIPVTLALLQLFFQALALGEQLGLELRRADALELRTAVLHRRAAWNGHLGHVIDVRAGLEHAEEVLLQHELLVLAGDAVFVAVGCWILVELGAVGLLAEGKQQFVERIGAMRMLAIEHVGARNILVIVLGPSHCLPTPD